MTRLVAPGVWTASYALRAEMARGAEPMARALLHMTHSAGLGAPIGATFDFAFWLTQGGGQGRLWADLLEGLLEGIERRKIGLMGRQIETALRGRPFDAAQVLFWPVVVRLLAAQDKNMLLTQCDVGDGPEAQAFSEYETAFDSGLQRLVHSDDNADLAFKKALCARLIQFSRARRAAPVDVPAIDGLASELFLAVTPEMPDHAGAERAVLSFADGLARQHARHRSDGVTGVRHASPTEDPSAMIPSQMVFPYRFLVERIENEGFVAFDRPPPLPQQQHLLCICLPVDLFEGPALSILRAAWWRACRYLEQMMQGPQTELSFCWESSHAGFPGRDALTHCPPSGRRSQPHDRARTYLAGFDRMGAPFLQGAMPLPDFAAPASSAGRRRTLGQDLRTKGVPLGQRDHDELRVYVLNVLCTDDPALAARQTEEARIEIAALDAAHSLRRSLRLPVSPDGQIELEDHDPLPLPSDFDGQCSVVVTLAETFAADMLKVLQNG